MDEMVEINIKSDGQTTDQAIGEFLICFERAKFCGTKLIKVITGYGSHGKGGEIKKALQKVLFKLKRGGEIKDFFSCEKLSKEDLHSLCIEFPFLICDSEISSYNSGVTLVVL